jgi:hypothetical protein
MNALTVDHVAGDAMRLALILAASHNILAETHRALPNGERHDALDQGAILVEVAAELAAKLVDQIYELPRVK